MYDATVLQDADGETEDGAAESPAPGTASVLRTGMALVHRGVYKVW